MTDDQRDEIIEGLRKTMGELLLQIKGHEAAITCIMSVVAEQSPELKRRLVEELKSVKILDPKHFPDYIDWNFGIANETTLLDFIDKLSR